MNNLWARLTSNLWTRRDAESPSNVMPPQRQTRAASKILSSSPLSSLDTTESEESDTSFVTAIPIPTRGKRKETGRDTDNGSDDDSDANSDTDSDDSSNDETPQYQKAKALPPELKEHCRVYLEEALPRQAISFLSSLLSSRPRNINEPVYCPPPSQISQLCSIIIHPDFTSRPREPDWPEISLQSLAYLRDLLSVFGPVNARFKESVLFNTNAISDLDSGSPSSVFQSPDADERGLVRLTPRFGRHSVWQRGRDFFSVVGWAFNCSVLYPERWAWWRRWLELMLDVIEKDLHERQRMDDDSGDNERSALRESILASYMLQRSGRTTDGIMWIMKALFADGSTSASSVFQEVWPREYKIKSRGANKRKREQVNIDKGDYGGYLDDDSVISSQASEPPTPQKKRISRDGVEEHTLAASYVETIAMRQRIFALVSYLCYNVSDNSFVDFENLYEKFARKIKELPLALFSSFVSTTTSALLIPQQIEILQCVLSMFMPSGATKPERVDRARAEEGGISPEILERCYLHSPANTIEAEDNAKMSLLLENLVMIVMQHGNGDEVFSSKLMQAVTKGIQARQEKAAKKKVRGRARAFSDPEAEARSVLTSSSSRLVWLAEAALGGVGNKASGDAMDED
ncbi:hypothetical protein F5Y17DRAFT_430168 [Xylariaceae sp. FL0594]|nr:hypothetical protein F5Y17DRAFT_430168 [Xylariaceae sp. FL0594]